MSGPAAAPDRRRVLLPAAVVALAALQLHAFGPGSVTPDTVVQWGQALSGRWDDWHPPATAWLWRQLMPFGPGTWPVLVAHALVYWGGVAVLAETLRRRGRGWAAAAVVGIAALPIPFGQGGAILKDPLLTALCLMATALAVAGERARVGPAMRGVAAALLIFAAATRFNAVFACVPLLVLLAPARWTATLPRLAVATVVAALILVGGNRLIDEALLRPHHSQPIVSLINFDLAGIAAQGGHSGYPGLDDAAAQAMAARCVTPSMFNQPNYPDCNAVEDALFADAKAMPGGITRLWLRTIAASPVAYARHRLAHLNRNWRWAVATVPGDAVYAMSAPNPWGLGFKWNGATRGVLAAAKGMAESPLGRPATWIAVALGLLLVAPAIRSRRVVTALACSALLYGGAYFVVSVAADMRYNVWTMVAAMLALAFAAGEWRKAHVARWRTVVALLLPLVAVAVEVATFSGGG